MSTPAGQSDEQPLQDRHRSSDPASPAAAKPCTSVPLASSFSTRARPRVESLSSLVASKDGHITPPPPTSPSPFFLVSARPFPGPQPRGTAADTPPTAWASGAP